jgi:hypothetical protein
LNPDGGKKFYRLHKRPELLWGPCGFPFDAYRCFSPGVKRSSRGVKLPPSSTASADDKKACSCTSAPTLCLQWHVRVNLNLYLKLGITILPVYSYVLPYDRGETKAGRLPSG